MSDAKSASLPVLLVVLTITTGLIDAISVLGLGRVFTANMTGNIVFLGFALAGVPGFSPSRSLIGLAAFLAGAVVGGRLGVRALAMGVRNATVRRLAVPDLTTTVLTLTLTGLGADSPLAGGSNPRWRRRVASVAAMLGGAVVGGLLMLRGGLGLPLVLTAAITLSATVVYVTYPARPAASVA